jgi:uncharacterized repeat protein (TIGR01451 family)
MRNVVVTETLPEGMDFVAASDRGIYRPSSRSIYWLVENLAPLQTRQLAVKVQPRMAGKFMQQAMARSENGEENRLATALYVESQPDVTVKLLGQDSHVALGREAVYEIQLKNQGSGVATGVNVLAILPEGMRLGHVKGPTPYQVQGQQVVFEPLRRLEPHSQMIYQIGALALAAGDRRIRVQVASDQLRLPLVREERTVIYNE